MNHARRPLLLRSVLSRRQALTRMLGLGAAAAAPGLLRAPAASGRPHQTPPPSPTPIPTAGSAPAGGAADPADALRPAIRPRADWAANRPVTGPLVAEDDVRFLLVHHTASTNDYGPDQVAEQIQGFYDFHTGPEKGWPDVAYNFFVDRYGGIWEGRDGSLAGAVRGDATGGSQGFAQLCSLIGNYQEGPVTAEQQASLTQLLAWLAQRHGIDTTPGATVTFVSRGSNRWPAGQEVTAHTIAGHRDMSLTSCPGDQAYALVAETLPAGATTLRAEAAAATSTTAVPPPATTAPTSTPATSAPPAVPATLGADTVPAGSDLAAAPIGGPADDDPSPLLLVGGAGAGLLAVLAGIGGRLRRRSGDHPGPPAPPGGP
ncbi:MAG: N-acetylmuramoyl-L-alanine amidase [Acidimicrobiales bacterium]